MRPRLVTRTRGFRSATRLLVPLGVLPSVLACGTQTHETSVATESAESGSEQPTGFGWVAVEAIEEEPSSSEVQLHRAHVSTLDDLTEALPLLASHNLSVALSIQAHKLQSEGEMDAIFSAIERAREQGVEVRPWLLLSFSDGYFPNATNADRFAQHAHELVDQWNARGLPPSTLVVDMEPPRELQQALSSTDLLEALPRDHVDRERYAEGQKRYAALVEALHAQGWQAQLTTLATLLADYRDDDDDLRQYFNVVIDGVDWDQIDFQLYRSAFSAQVPGLGPHFVYAYVKEALARFPDTDLGFTLGLTHPGPIFLDTPTLEDGAALRKDVEAALAAGADPSRLSVFSLLGILKGPPHCPKVLSCSPEEYAYSENHPERWLQPPASRTTVPESSAATSMLSAIFDGMDAVLDVAPATDEN